MSKKDTFKQLREEEKNKRRNIIVDAAENEFATKPFHKVNMRDIAKKAGISPASIYRYFPDQESLFLEAFVRGTKDIFLDLKTTSQEAEDGAISKVTEKFIDYFTRNDQYFRMMMHFFLDGKENSSMFGKLSTLERSLLDVFDDVFKKMNSKGNIRFKSHAYFSSLVGIVATFRNRPDKNKEDELIHRKRIADVLAEQFRE